MSGRSRQLALGIVPLDPGTCALVLENRGVDDIGGFGAQGVGRWRGSGSFSAAVTIALLLATGCTEGVLETTQVPEGMTAPGTGVVADLETTTTTSPPAFRTSLEQVFGGLISENEPPTAEWVGDMPFVAKSFMAAVTVGGPGLVAAGTAHSGDEAGTDAAVWTSPDGRAWARLEDDGGVFGGEGLETDQWVNDVAGGRRGVVAVGADGLLFEHDAAVWVSSDGLAWERLPPDPEVFGGEGDQIMYAVLQAPEVVIAIGESAGEVAAWVSDDGRQWSRAEVNDDSMATGMEPSLMVDVAATDTGFVGVGSSGPDAQPAVWLSPDGHSWSRLVASMAGGGSGFESPMSPMSGVAAGELGLVAIGTELRVDEDPTTTARATWRPLVWTSADGFEWRLLESTFVGPTDEEETSRYAYLKEGSPVVLTDVAWDGDRLFAIGEYDLEPSAYATPNFVTLWTSMDGGSTWEVADELTLPATEPGRGARAFTRFGDSLVLVGLDDVPAGEHPEGGWTTYAQTPAVWIADLPAP
jgi:hypothetical protein